MWIRWRLEPVLECWGTLSMLRAQGLPASAILPAHSQAGCPVDLAPHGDRGSRELAVTRAGVPPAQPLLSIPAPMAWGILKYSRGPFPLYPSRLCYLLEDQAKVESCPA